MSEQYAYPGEELILFEQAKHWKKYFGDTLQPFIYGNVLEVGAGIGGTTSLLFNDRVAEWTMLEPDTHFRDQLMLKSHSGQLPGKCLILEGNIDSLSANRLFDVILYIDVLEHIEDDQHEMKKAASYLKEGGHLIILSPAFQFLYSPFDKAIGHYRRYNKQSLSACMNSQLTPEKLRYLDSTGFFASLINKMLLRQRYPTIKQILFWDKWLIPVSRVLDKIVGHSFGKSIVGIWKKL